VLQNLKKSDKIALSVRGCLLLCCGGAGIIGNVLPERTTGDPAPAVTTTAPPRVGVADLPTVPTRDLEAERVEASKSAAAYQRRVDAYNAKKAKEAEEAQEAEERRLQAELDAAEEEKQQEENNDLGGGVYYKNCTAVRAAGADPIRRGDPGYARHLDRDGDGVGCE